MFEAIIGPEWRMENEKTGELVKYNFDRTRKLSYVGREAEDGDVFATMKMSFLDNDGQWREVINLRHYDFDNFAEEKVVITVMVTDENIGPMTIRYSEGKTNVVEDKRWSKITDPRVLEDRRELLLSYDELPERIDLVLTANLFVDQMIRGEMVRPVLVPEGYFQYEEPGEVSRAERLLAEAKNAEELKVAKAINRWVMDQEMARVAMDLD